MNESHSSFSIEGNVHIGPSNDATFDTKEQPKTGISTTSQQTSLPGILTYTTKKQIRLLYCDLYSGKDGVASKICKGDLATRFIEDDELFFRMGLFYEVANEKGILEDFKWPSDIKVMIRAAIDDPGTPERNMREWIFRKTENEFYLPWPPPIPPGEQEPYNHTDCVGYDFEKAIPVEVEFDGAIDETALNVFVEESEIGEPCNCKSCYLC